MYNDYGDTAVSGRTDDEILADACEGVRLDPPKQLVSDNNYPLETYPGRELVYLLVGNDLMLTHRVFVVDARLYQVIAVLDSTDGMTDDAQRFLDSFQLIKG